MSYVKLSGFKEDLEAKLRQGEQWANEQVKNVVDTVTGGGGKDEDKDEDKDGPSPETTTPGGDEAYLPHPSPPPPPEEKSSMVLPVLAVAGAAAWFLLKK